MSLGAILHENPSEFRGLRTSSVVRAESAAGERSRAKGPAWTRVAPHEIQFLDCAAHWRLAIAWFARAATTENEAQRATPAECEASHVSARRLPSAPALAPHTVKPWPRERAGCALLRMGAAQASVYVGATRLESTDLGRDRWRSTRPTRTASIVSVAANRPTDGCPWPDPVPQFSPTP